MRSIRSTHHGLHAPPPPTPTPTWSWLVLAFMKRGLISQLHWNDPNSQRSRRPPAFACALLRNSFFFFQLLSPRLSLLLSAATCASYNFSFLSPQGLNFSSSQSSAPFWSGTMSFLLFSSPCCFTRRSLGQCSIHHTHSHLEVLFNLIMSQHICCSRDAGVPQWQKKKVVNLLLFSQSSRRGWSARRWPGTTLRRGTWGSCRCEKATSSGSTTRSAATRDGGKERPTGVWVASDSDKGRSQSVSGRLCLFSRRQFKNLFLCWPSVMSQPSTVINVHPDGSSNSAQHPQIWTGAHFRHAAGQRLSGYTHSVKFTSVQGTVLK